MRTCPSCQRLYIDSQSVCPLDQATLGAPDGETKLAPGLGKELGSYKLISLLGMGGMGSIYIGAHTRLNRYVAVKLVRREHDKRSVNVTRFFDEASTVNRIKHPNVVESIDLVEDVVDGSYCVMELLNGTDLKARIAKGPVPLESAIHIAAQIADALEAVHELDIVHRDLKPDNLMLLQRGERDDFVKLIDFGVAQTTTEPGTGAPVGTAAYMAPEQAAGERVDGRADLYALGVLLFEMTTGQHPFPSSTDTEYLLRHADDPPPAPSRLQSMPTALEDLILRCLAKEPSDRFPTAASVATALRAIDLDAQHTEECPPTRRSTTASTRGGSGGAVKWVAAVVLVLGGAAAVIVPRYLRDAEAIASTPAAAQAPVVASAEPAPTPASEIAVAPAPPATVMIDFITQPAGATVTRAGETVPLGVTPFVASLVRSDKMSRVRVELAGHVPQEIEVPLAASSSITIPMTRVPALVSKQPVKTSAPKKSGEEGGKPKQVQREGVMDPFAN